MMRNLTALLFITVCLFIQPAHVEGQSSFFDFLNTNDTNDDFTIIDAYYLGRAVAANILSVYRPYTASPEATQYLNSICQTLVINSNYPPTYNGYHVMILDSDEFNAFASPAGHIFITRRLLSAVTSEDMLAAIIAHEIAHVVLRHSITIINEARFENEMSAIADRAADAAARLSDRARQTAEFRSSITRTIDIMLRSGYSQAQEFEADLEATVILSRAGYDPRALVEMLRILQLQGSQRGGLYSTHPSPALRITNVQKYSYPNITTSRYRTDRFRNLRW
jgi:predicted Zn-dependent protease